MIDVARVHIFGASGSGTTTLGAALAHALGAEHLDSDDYFWMPTDPPYVDKRPPAERLDMLRNDLPRGESWVLSGSLCGWGDALIPSFTLAVFLWLDPALRLARLEAREMAEFGDRLAPGGDMHEAHDAFMSWAASYDDGDLSTRSRALHERWMATLPCPVLRLDAAARPVALLDATLAKLRAPNKG